MKIDAEFRSAQAVTPGQGQTVTIAGVKVGEIGEVSLENGPRRGGDGPRSRQAGPVYRNAHLLLRPKTGLNDMSIQLDPARRTARFRGAASSTTATAAGVRTRSRT